MVCAWATCYGVKWASLAGRGRCTTGCTILVILNGNSKTDTHLTDFNEAMTMVSVNKWSK